MPLFPYDSRNRDIKPRIFSAIFVLVIIYIGFSFAFHAFADPPTNDYYPGETLSPTCVPGSTNCTVDPPLFSSSTLPIGGVPYVADSIGTMAANTSSLYFNPTSATFSVSGGQYGGGLTVGTTTLMAGYYGNIVASDTNGLQWNLQNFSPGSYSEFVMTADKGSSSTDYGGVGINNSAESSTGENPYDLFLEDTNGVDVEPCVTGVNSSQCDVQFMIGGNASTNEKFTIASSSIISVEPFVASSTLTVAGAAFLGSNLNVTSTATFQATTTDNASFVFGGGVTQSQSAALLSFGSSSVSFTNASGTYIGINSSSSAKNPDFLDFQVAGITDFRVASTGATVIGTSTIPTGNLLTVAGTAGLGIASNTEGQLIFYNSQTSSTLSFRSSTSTASNITLTFPGTAGLSGQALVTDGNGNLSWASTGFTKTVSSTATKLLTSSVAAYVTLGITPSNVASDIWITGAVTASTTQGTSSVTLAVYRGSNACTTQEGNSVVVVFGEPTSTQAGIFAIPINVLDAPATTSVENYTLCAKTTVTNNASLVGGSMTLQEVRQGSDIAEAYNAATDTPLEPGDVVSPDPSIDAGVMQSQTPYDNTLLGVISTQPGAVLGNSNPDSGSQVLVALAGRVPVNVTSENGNINVGDYLTSSDVLGVAMRATQPGKTIGIALESFTPDPSTGISTGTILMFVNPGWALGSLTDPALIASSSWALENASSGTQFVLDQFTAYVQAALAKLGVNIENGIVTLQQLIANQITTNVLCVQGTCINGNQLQQLLNQEGVSAVTATTTDDGSSSGVDSGDVSTTTVDATTDASTTVASSTTPDDSTFISDPTSTDSTADPTSVSSSSATDTSSSNSGSDSTGDSTSTDSGGS